MRWNKVEIILESKEPVDEELLAKYGEEEAIMRQRVAVAQMLEEFLVYDEFDVSIIVTNEEEDE